MSTKINAIEVTTYADLNAYATKFAAGHFNLIGVLGSPGLGKTQVFRQAMGTHDHLLVNGHHTAFQMYQRLHEQVDQPVIIDDADTLFKDRPTKPLLKALCDTIPAKLLQWQSKAIDDEDVPRRFVTRSRAAVLANSWSGSDADMKAVIDRGIFSASPPTLMKCTVKSCGADGSLTWM